MFRPSVAVSIAALAVATWACADRWTSTPSHATFPLAGAHLELSCERCHTTPGTYAGLQTACASCHEDDRKDADHYPGQDCGDCHLATDWGDGVVDHAFFPLAQAHALPCASCHTAGDPDLDPTCSSCHEPDRPAGHFGGECGDCHPITRWGDGTFDHTWFPVPHRGVSACTSCHPDDADREVFTCTDCHAHARGEMDDEHDDEGGYTYDSAACYRCHPNGREEDD